MTQHPPTNPWHEPQHHQHRANSMLIPGMIVGALLLGVGCLSGLLVGFLGATSGPVFPDVDYDASAPATPLDVALTVEPPPAIAVGEPFDLIVTVADEGSRAHELLTLDLRGALCDNFDVIAITPEPKSTHTEYGWHEYTYNTTLDADASASVTVTLEPRHEGVFEGEVEAFLDDWSSVSASVTITVGPRD